MLLFSILLIYFTCAAKCIIWLHSYRVRESRTFFSFRLLLHLFLLLFRRSVSVQRLGCTITLMCFDAAARVIRSVCLDARVCFCYSRRRRHRRLHLHRCCRHFTAHHRRRTANSRLDKKQRKRDKRPKRERDGARALRFSVYFLASFFFSLEMRCLGRQCCQIGYAQPNSLDVFLKCTRVREMAHNISGCTHQSHTPTPTVVHCIGLDFFLSSNFASGGVCVWREFTINQFAQCIVCIWKHNIDHVLKWLLCKHRNALRKL